MTLAVKYVLFHKVRSVVFIAILSVAIALPFLSQTFSQSLVKNVNQRTESSPVVLASRSGKVRQTLASLFFILGEEAPSMNYGVFEDVMKNNGLAVPLFIKHSTQYGPLIATEIDYFLFRRLNLAKGDLFALPGDTVLGHSVAEMYKIKIGDTIKIQSTDIYDITNSPPIDLKVTGILAKSFSPDDTAVFTSLQTIWVLEGFLHSHTDQDPFKTTSLDKQETSYSKSLKTSQDISEQNLLQFHFHSDLSSLPISHVIFRGNTHKSEVLLIDEYNKSTQTMAFRPRDSLDKVMQIFLSLEHFFAAYHLFWSLCTLIMIALIFGLIIQTRQEEFQVLLALGASHNLVWLNITQMILIYFGVALAGAFFLHLLAESALSSYFSYLTN